MSKYIEKNIRRRWKVHEIAVEDVTKKHYSVGAEKERETTVKMNSSDACDKTSQLKQWSTVVCIKEKKNNQKI